MNATKFGISYVELHLGTSADFPKRFGKKLKAIVGAEYRACRGYSTTRIVKMPLPSVLFDGDRPTTETVKRFALIETMLVACPGHQGHLKTGSPREAVEKTTVMFRALYGDRTIAGQDTFHCTVSRGMEVGSMIRLLEKARKAHEAWYVGPEAEARRQAIAAHEAKEAQDRANQLRADELRKRLTAVLGDGFESFEGGFGFGSSAMLLTLDAVEYLLDAATSALPVGLPLPKLPPNLDAVGTEGDAE